MDSRPAPNGIHQPTLLEMDSTLIDHNGIDLITMRTLSPTPTNTSASIFNLPLLKMKNFQNMYIFGRRYRIFWQDILGRMVLLALPA